MDHMTELPVVQPVVPVPVEAHKGRLHLARGWNWTEYKVDSFGGFGLAF